MGIIFISIFLFFFVVFLIFYFNKSSTKIKNVVLNKIHHTYEYINDHNYEIISIFPENNVYEMIIIHIPGNPGLIGFYENYFSKLFEKFNKKIKIIGCSNRGLLIEMPDNYEKNYSKYKRFTMNEQIKHHLNFIKHIMIKHPNKKIVFTCHSLGSYFLNKIMKKIDMKKIQAIFLLFPAIENLNLSKNAQKFTKKMVANHLSAIYIISFLYSILSIFPNFIKIQIILLLKLTQERHIINSVLKLINFKALLNFLNLGSESIRYVKSIDYNIFKKHQNKICFLLGIYDEWVPCPVLFYEKLKKKFPKSIFQIDDGNISHAYIMEGLNETIDFIYKQIKILKI